MNKLSEKIQGNEANTLLAAAVPDYKDMEYDKVRTIGKEKYCIKGISCNLCDFMDREKGKINSCVEEYVKRHCS